MDMEWMFWLGIGAIFGYMIVEDWRFQTVDDKWVIGLGAWVVLGRALMGQAMPMMSGAIVSGVFGIVVFIIGLTRTANSESRIEDDQQKDVVRYVESSENIINMHGIGGKWNENEGLAFLPSLGVSLLVWFWVMPKERLGNMLGEVAMVFKWICTEHIGILGLILVLCFGFKVVQLYGERRKGELVYGFGDGDVLVCIVLGAMIGWQGFLVVFFIGMIVQLVMYGGKALLKTICRRRMDNSDGRKC